jgi:hypothetical protein
MKEKVKEYVVIFQDGELRVNGKILVGEKRNFWENKHIIIFENWKLKVKGTATIITVKEKKLKYEVTFL